MKHSLLIIAVISFLVPSIASAQGRESPTMKDQVDGHYWLKLDEAGKMQLIDGIKYGTKIFWGDVAAAAENDSSAARSMENFNPRDTATFATPDIIKQIDTLYSDTTNIRIPMEFIYRYTVAKLSGEASKKLGQMLDTWKKER